jgi:hypothetical protein
MSDLIKIITRKKIEHSVSDNGAITVPGNLDLEGITITSLPDNLSVAGGLYLQGCTGITSLPDNLSVAGGLDLQGCTGITSLPDNLSVAGGLYLCGTGITSLPDNLSVKGSFYLDPQHIDNVAYRENCGYSSRTIFAVWMDNTFKIAAGCFFDTLDAFEDAVDEKYSGVAAEKYKQAARDCVTELTEKLNKAVA